MEQSVMASYFRVILEGLKQYPPSSRFTKSELQYIFADILSKCGILSESGKNSTSLSAATGTSSWFFDSACCNHMTSDSTIFSSKSHATHTPAIQTADGSHMHASHVGHISTFTISLSDTYLIPKLTLNLISVGQLCELGLTVIFSATGCHVQDPRTAMSASPFFIDPSADIFLDDVDIGSSELPSTTYPEAPLLFDDPTPSDSSLSEPEPLPSPSSPPIELPTRPLSDDPPIEVSAPPLSDTSPLRRSTRMDDSGVIAISKCKICLLIYRIQNRQKSFVLDFGIPYASDLLSRAGITDNKTASTPLEPTTRLTPLDGLADYLDPSQNIFSMVAKTPHSKVINWLGSARREPEKVGGGRGVTVLLDSFGS
ncbi:hypothetical protein RHSIM_Rhsim12G0169100 [Rhododendron simsii]|uniref:Retrovirus-related Pol polyprotein from transposon TNT 1-94-like beta-barrel domain-containing protein n=1 Tax=Rhododendron simsii TaxID=118357 RepID=A0A834G5V2_RHOSS|nr:hypothetical protein RHSIM_Rhsim12G0169100 [Rhododendron simsii]